ncbi:GntR family transcriptional regulator, partial [Myxococcus xanthus]|nr:GntR family transcriptional regulator [Myxococcus xanthus]
MLDAASSVQRMKGRIQGRLILDAETLRGPRSVHLRKKE